MSDSTPEIPTPINHEELHRRLLENELIVADRLYLDWSLLRDPYIGAVISLLMSAPDQNESAQKFAVLKNKAALYEDRCFNDIARYMPELGFSMDTILERLNDQQYHEQIFFGAPFTLFIQTLRAHIELNVNHSQVAEKYKKIPVKAGHYQRDYEPIRLYVNTYPLILKKKHHDFIGVFLSRNYAVDVEICSIAHKDLPLDFLLQMDEIYTNNLVDLLENTAFSAALTDLKFLNKTLFAVRHLGHHWPITVRSRAIEAEFLRLQAMLSILCKFHWISPKILSYSLSPPPVKEE